MQTPEPPDAPDDPLAILRRRAYEFLRFLNNERAIEVYTEIISKSPTADDYRLRAFCRNEIEDFPGAIADCDEAISLDSSLSTAWNNRGFARMKLDMYEEAILDYTEAVHLDPEFVIAWQNRGKSFSLLRLFDLAVQDYTRAIEIRAEGMDGYLHRASALEDADHFQEALEDYSVVLSIEPNQPVAYNNRGHLRIKLEQYEEAKIDFENALRIWNVKDHAQAVSAVYWRQAFIHSQLRSYDIASTCLERSFEIDSTFPKMDRDFGWIPHLATKFTFHLPRLRESSALIALTRILKKQTSPLEELIDFLVTSENFSGDRVQLFVFSLPLPLIAIQSWLVIL